MRVCLVYDCLYPYTVGGAERWYRNLAERLAADGHEVTYLTLRQWPRGDEPRDRRRAGRRRRAADGAVRRARARAGSLPPLVFGAGVLWHLLRHGRRYDVVHTASFPYFSLLAAGAGARRCARYRLVVDWHEMWTRARTGASTSAGSAAASAGGCSALCVRVPQRAFCFSRLHERRLRERGPARRR